MVSSSFVTVTLSLLLASAWGLPNHEEQQGARVWLSSSNGLRSGQWVAIQWAGIREADLRRNATEFVCVQDSYCHNDPLSVWIGLFPLGANLTAIGPQRHWPNGDPPWVATYPIAWKPINASEGTAKFKLDGVMAPNYIFALFANGTNWPILLSEGGVAQVTDYQTPRHVRLARVESPSAMRVSWTSAIRDAKAKVRWGSAPGRYSHSEAAVVSTYTKDELCGPPATMAGWSEPGWLYTAVIGPIGPSDGCSIFYTVGSDVTGWSEEFSLCAPVPPSGTSRLRVAVLADVGVTYADGSQYHWMEPFAGNTTTLPLRQAAAPGPRNGNVLEAVQDAMLRPEGRYDLVLHVGDLAYATGYASKWDRFMDSIEALSSQAPYMTAIGNHERDWRHSGSDIGGGDSGGECGIPVEARFLMPVQNRTQAQGWYSFEQGPVHFVVMESELTAARGSPQWNFFQRDLQSVDRKRTPWVVFAGHRPMYSSTQMLGQLDSRHAGYDLEDGPWWPDVEELLVKYQVDLCLWGHVHNAEQTCPLINGTCVNATEPGGYDAPVHAVIGNGGQSLTWYCLPKNFSCCCSSTGVSPQCQEACDAMPVWSRWRMDSFGYSVLEAEGSTELTLKFFQDCVPKVDRAQQPECTEFNKHVHSFTIKRRPGLRDEPVGPEIVV